jgi:hypothetical protein
MARPQCDTPLVTMVSAGSPKGVLCADETRLGFQSGLKGSWMYQNWDLRSKILEKPGSSYPNLDNIPRNT